MKYIGKMIGSLRCEKEISQKDLARGVISTAELSRIENGTKEANSLILEVLLQRLGKSLDRLEYIASNEEYQEICLKEMICQELACEDYEMAEMLLTEYEAYGAENNVLCRQFVMQIRAVIAFVRERNIGQCCQRLQEALKLTQASWKKEMWTGEKLCTQEIQILLTLYYLRLLEQTINEEEIVRLAEYIDSHYTEEKEKVKVFPQAVYLAGRAAFAEGNFGKAYKLYQAGKQCLMENGVLDLMSKILEGEKECLEKTERWEEAAKREKTLTAIDFLYEQAQKKKTEEEILFFVLKSYQKDVVISNELLRELREEKGVSQEEISEGVCAQETLCRIETQKRAPKHRTVRGIFEKLDYDRRFFQGYVVSDDYYAYELVGKINKNWYKKNKEEAYRLVEELKQILDLSIPVNRQYIGHEELQRKIEEEKLNWEEIADTSIRLLRYTMKDFSGQVYRELSIEEFVIINYMALCLKKAGRMKEAENLYQQVQEVYKKSILKEKNRMGSQFLYYINYVGLLEEEDKLSEAIAIGKQGLNFALDCQRGDIAATVLANMACAYEKMSEKKELAKECLRNDYYLMLLYEHEKDADKIKKYYESRYGVDIV